MSNGFLEFGSGREMLESSTAGLCTLSQSGMIETVDPLFEQMFGFGKGELSGKDVRTLLSPEAAASLDTLQPVAGRSSQTRGQRKDGSTFPLQITIQELTVAGVIQLLGIMLDMSKELAAQEAAATRLRLTALAAAIGIAITHAASLEDLLQRCAAGLVKHLDAAFARIWTLNSEGDTLDLRASAGLYTHLNGPHAHVPVGKFKIGLIAAERRPHLTNSVQTDPRVGDKDWARREGMIAFAGHPLIVNGRLVGVMALFARRKLSNEVLDNLAAVADGVALGIERFHGLAALLWAKDAAEAAVVAKGQFLNTMSHEIRTPLNAIIGMANILAQTPLSAEQAKFVGVINNSGKALLGVISDVLDFSKIGAGKIDLEYIPFHLPNLVEETVNVIATLADEKQLELCLDLHPETPVDVVGDGLRIRQILLNLLSNAIKFTDKGAVTLTIEEDSGARGADNWLRFTVQDSGIGISKEAQIRIFESFQQADSSTTRRYGGSGLGLAISKGLVQLMGGRMGVVSEPGHGSSFWFSLPLPVVSGSVRPLPAKIFVGKRVLLVEDNLAQRQILERQLSHRGMHVVTFPGSQEAISFISTCGGSKSLFDLAILDAHISPVDGAALARQITLDHPQCTIPVVLLTSIRDIEPTLSIATAVVCKKVTKPVSMESLLAAMREALGEPTTIVARKTLTETPQKLLGKQILVVEDNNFNQMVIEAMLQNAGCTLHLADSGRQAISLWESNTYDLILMDCQMAEMDGYEATAAIRKQEAPGVNTPIIALTANSSEEDRRRCFAAGMNDYLTKPVEFPTLVAMLEKWIRGAETLQ